MQAASGSKESPIGIVYNTTMSRPDAALALALLYGFQGKREAKIGSVCVNGTGLGAAVYCDVLSHFYSTGQGNSNTIFPTGLAADGPLPSDPPMVVPVIEAKTVRGEFQCVREIRNLSDTSVPEVVIRNGVIANAHTTIVLSAPAGCLANSLALLGTKELYRERVKTLIIVDAGVPQDLAAMRTVLNEMPTDIVFCPKEVGAAIRYPSGSIEKDFAWAPRNPVVDAYRAFQAMPYDAPGFDLAAILYAVHSEPGYFGVSEPGTVTVGSDGMMRFAPGGRGKVRSLILDPSKRDEVVDTLVAVATSKPVTPTQRIRPGAVSNPPAIKNP